MLAAQRWRAVSSQKGLVPPQMLLGLLAEEESRAALMLAAHGIDVSLVCQQWPEWRLDEATSTSQVVEFSTGSILALKAAEARLSEYPRPLILATEHLLLGLVAVGDEVSHWLVERGFDADRLENELHRLAGHQPGPLPIDDGPMPPSSPVVDIAVVPKPTKQIPVKDVVQPTRTTNTPPSVTQTTGVLRVIDAAANRAREGLRVVEDYVRFVLDDAHLTEQLKTMRHELTAAALAFLDCRSFGQSRDASRCRNAIHDFFGKISRRRSQRVGGQFQASARIAAQLGRSSASCRPPTSDAEFERLRYRSYTLERATSRSRARASTD